MIPIDTHTLIVLWLAHASSSSCSTASSNACGRTATETSAGATASTTNTSGQPRSATRASASALRTSVAVPSGTCTSATAPQPPAAVRAALGRHRVLHRYTAHYDAAAACLVIAVPDDDNGDSNGTTLTGAPDAPAHVPALRVLAVEPVGGRSAAAPRRVLACPCADPTAAPVTLACTGRLSPLVVCSPLLSCLPLWWSLLGMHAPTHRSPGAPSSSLRHRRGGGRSKTWSP